MDIYIFMCARACLYVYVQITYNYEKSDENKF